MNYTEGLPRRARSISLLSQVFGDGGEILKIEGTLAEAIQRFNDNFRKEESFNGQVQQSITLLDSEIIDIVRNEEKLKNKLTELHISLHNYQMSRDYMMAKTNKLSELENMLRRSTLAGQLELLERASFHKSICSLQFCELEIHTEQKGNTVLIHKKMITLEPVSKFVVTCAAASTSEISTWHNRLAIQTTANSFLINNTIVTTEQLRNKTLANMMLRPISENEVLLGKFIIYGSNLQCLQAIDFMLNQKPLKCKALQSFSLPLDYEIEVNGRKLVQHIITRKGQLINNKWLEEFDVPLSNENF